MKYKLELTQQEIQIISAGLGELPLKVSANVYGKIQEQVRRQDEENAMPIETLMRTADQRKDAL